MKRDITFFFTDGVEQQTTRAVAEEAARRGYVVSSTDKLDAPAEIGFFCSHRPSPRRCRFSAIMLHDLAQRHDRWPYYWRAEPWHEFDVGFLPGPSWAERWALSSGQRASRPRRGVFALGWPKADALFSGKEEFQQQAAELRATLRLRHERSVLYAPSWENHGKQDDFVRALRGLPVNLLLKQAPWSPAYPDVLGAIAAMNALHAKAGPDVHIVSPEVPIVQCLALADLMVSEESSVLIEALLLDVPGIAVMDWLVPDQVPPRPPSVPFDFVIRTQIARLRQTVEEILARLPDARSGLAALREREFSCLGESAPRIMDVIDACVDGRPSPWPALEPSRPLSWVGSLRERLKASF